MGVGIGLAFARQAGDDVVVLPGFSIVDGDAVVEVADPDAALQVAGDGVAVVIAEAVGDGELLPEAGVFVVPPLGGVVLAMPALDGNGARKRGWGHGNTA